MESNRFRELLARVRRGDQGAAAEILETYEGVLRRIVRVRLVDPRLRRVISDSDVVQSVMGSFFVRVGLGQYELESPSDLLRLLAVMARNKVAAQARRRDPAREGEPLDEGEGPGLASPSASPSRIIATRQLLEMARARLSPELLELVSMRERGLEWAAVAEQLGGRPEALRKRLKRAVDQVARELGLDETG